MKRNLWWVAVALALPVAGCGSGSGAESSAKPEATASSTQQEAGDVALRYVQGIADGDWEQACETRLESEQQDMAQYGGSCEKAFAAIFEGKPTDLFEDVEVGDVRVEGERAEVDLVQPGQSKPALTLIAVKRGEGWRLIDE